MTVNENPQSSTSRPSDDDVSPNLVFETTYEYGTETDELTVLIVDAIADEMDVSPVKFVSKINEAVNPDAMERILRPLPDGTKRNGQLIFFLHGFRISIHGDGTVRIHETPA
ncbi:hypothetical protein KTS45_06460 [Halomicroarcula limicola]|uniref:Halobacterial output domain-containing protein n=1 Tax=Haloarcula limicola TaxID=1429915 RepID=A0A8J7Y4H9_9EURY|nr:HalOD1 output domain-containing protein [Halomicroarcula limicola]MBV0923842.1 hypothetical protein [Halomicroarcula limicola]